MPKSVSMNNIHLELSRLLKNEGIEPVKVAFWQRPNGIVVLEVQDAKAAAFCDIEVLNMNLPLERLSEQYLKPAAINCAQFLREAA